MRIIDRLKVAAAASALFLCAACSAPMPDAKAAIASNDDAYFVLGAQPKNIMLQIDQAVIKDGQIVRFVNTLPLHEYGQTQGDFIVVKAKGGATLAIQSASIMAGHSIFGILYYPCSETLSFQAPAGKVVYLTNVNYTMTGGRGLQSTHHQDFQAAKDFMAMHYPLLADKLEQGQFQDVKYGRRSC